jgi:membrane-associated phospholipid phosphatase
MATSRFSCAGGGAVSLSMVENNMNESSMLPRGQMAVLILTACTIACSSPSEPSVSSCVSAAEAFPQAADTLASVQWNLLARDFVTKYRTDPSARPYALLSAAQYASTLAVRRAEGAACPSVRAAVRTASVEVLSYLYPAESLVIRSRALSQAAADSGHGVTTEARLAGEVIGRAASAPVLARARVDGVDAVWTGTIPTTPGSWRSAGAPTTPMLGQMLPWVLSSGSEFRPAAPPAFGSTAFNEALAEVKAIAQSRTAAQSALAVQWALGGGTYRTQGYWNAVASDLVSSNHVSEHGSAHALALLNVAMNDASIACFDAKYVYWLIRPSQADPTISLPISLSNHPSYPSSHSCTSGAASEVIAFLYPSQASTVRATATEISLSRLYGGIHYRFDLDTGTALGQRVGRRAIERDQSAAGLLGVLK